MELGIDRHKIEALKALGLRIAADPVMLRASISAALLVIGVLALEQPQAARLDTARKRQEEAQKRADTSDDLRFLERQVKNYEPRLGPTADLVDWSNYVLAKLEQSGATLHAMEPKKILTSGPFKVIDIDVTAQGSYDQLTDFVDRLERGERVVRMDRILIQRMRNTINLECTIKGLVKLPTTKAAEEPVHG